ncbi:MAG: transcription-repair coupling factor [Lachnospiraceae bacterium]|nr:transcription-repair coupling factor [Lachnospiraceae bacterium]
MKTYTEPLREITEYNEMAGLLKKKPCLVRATGCIDSQKCHFVAGLMEDFPVRVFVTYNDLKARELCEDMRLYDPSALVYPSKDVIFYSADVRGNAIIKERLSVIKKLLSGEPLTIIMCIDGGIDHLMPLEDIRKNVIKISAGNIIDISEMADKLVSLGYERQSQVGNAGEFAIRGGIIDIFPLNEDAPVRIELFDDEVDTLRVFDVDSQRSVNSVEEITIYPASEYILTNEETSRGILALREEEKKTEEALRKKGKNAEAFTLKQAVSEFIESLEYCRGRAGVDAYIKYFKENTVSFFDYFDENTVFILDEPARLYEKGEATKTEFRESMKGRLENGNILPGQAGMIFDYKVLLAGMKDRRSLVLSMMDYKEGELKADYSMDVFVKSVNPYGGNFELLGKDIAAWKKKKYRVIVQAGGTVRAERITKALNEDFDLPAFYSTNKDRVLQPGEIMVVNGALHKGFEYPYLKFVVLSESDVFGAEKKRKTKKYNLDGKSVESLRDLTFGDYVVHENQGLGIYRGIEKIEVDKVIKDFVKIEYGDGGILYIPATGLDVIQKYASADAQKKPKLNKMNSTEWKTTKAKVRYAVKTLAMDLTLLYAKRQQISGFSFSPDTVWQKEFEEQFPYDETGDQLRAIEDIKRDMESTKIMDRLVCGDVGYGKTEVAIRAAFKAVMDGKQVAVLVPTTILAQQHYNTFSTRMNRFGARVDMLSRFCTPTQVKNTVEGLKNGNVDVVIGTHRLLSKDINFRKLGLLIVDEEQRFGVAHKEKIKSLRENVDVLTLSATPIPRTLHMSLSGIRDMSLLEEPPVDRLPIQTFVMEHNDEIIREAINRELMRNGQVYYVFNRVNGIEEVALSLQKLIPAANIAYAHGKMSERELERIMYDFINGEIDVLVSTTIIETGLDISNVNTMIIDDADKMGLSQLYQLRGRVGRSNRTSYAFLMYKRDKMLKEVAEKRLQAIKEFSDLGSGFKIAMRDLEIRGAGNLLGAEQSGHMGQVGYDMYCKMLNEAIKECRGELKVTETYETSVDIDADAYIPSTYIKNEVQKLDIYKRIANILNEDDLSDVRDELIDRFGDIPASTDNLLRVALIKAMCHDVYITALKQEGESIRLNFIKEARFNTEKLPPLMAAYKGRLKVESKEPVTFVYTLPKSTARLTPQAETDLIFTSLTKLLKELFEMKEEQI